MHTVQQGDIIKVHFLETSEDGTIIDTSLDSEPLEFRTGSGAMIPGFDQAVLGMRKGEFKTFTVSAEQGYGPYVSDLAVEVDENEFLSRDFQLEIGDELDVVKDDGQVVIVRVTDITNDKVTLDANHPLAGKNLTFKIKLLEILPGTGDFKNTPLSNK